MYSIGAVPSAAADPLEVQGPHLTLRYATQDDAPALFELASDPAVTRYFSWGPYTSRDQPEAYIAGLPGKRERGELLDFLIVHERARPDRRDRAVGALAPQPPRDGRHVVRAPLVGERREPASPRRWSPRWRSSTSASTG